MEIPYDSPMENIPIIRAINKLLYHWDAPSTFLAKSSSQRIFTVVDSGGFTLIHHQGVPPKSINLHWKWCPEFIHQGFFLSPGLA
jgi:hypothetical protein